MRKSLALVSVIFLTAGLAFIAGCGGGLLDQQINIGDILLSGENWTYEGNEGDLLVLAEDGTFRSVIGGEVEDGSYKVFQADDRNWVELTFQDGEGGEERVEEWGMTADLGAADIITDTQGQQFQLRGTRETLR